MADLSEAWKAIADKLAADSTLTDLLGGVTEIYVGREISREITPPSIRLWCLDDGLNGKSSVYGYFEPRLQIDIFAVTVREQEQIKSRLDVLLEIPRSVPAGMTVSGFDLKSMRRVSGMHVGKINIKSTGVLVQHMATEWNLKLAISE